MLSFFTKYDATLKRNADGSWVDGSFVVGAEVDTPIRITAPQPLRANERQTLSEGDRQLNHVRIWTETQLFSGVKEVKNADRVVYLGKTYEVSQVDDWLTDGNHYEAVCKELNV